MNEINKNKYSHVINVSVVDPLSGLYSAGTLLLLKEKRRAKTLWYATVEGYFRRTMFSEHVFTPHDYVANSEFTKEILERYGLKVADVVCHGISESKIEKAMALGDRLKAELDKIFPNKVRFVVVASDRRRKGWPELIEAWRMLDGEVRKNSIVLYISMPAVEVLLEKEGLSKEFIRYAHMGSLPHERVLALIRACDFMIFPTLCEGFGLPPLEAIALGTPVIHAWFRPLNEFMPRTQFTINVEGVEEYIDRDGRVSGQVYLLHKYDVADLTRKIEEAYYFIQNSRDEYEHLRDEISQHAKRFYTSNVYRWFVDWVKTS